ncbi:MAG TPA: methyltransferase [Luteimonas sp.]|nr:methyltransferase [Luteimonas sp.]
MPASPGDPALDALLLPFTDGSLAWPDDGALMLGAREGAALQRQPWPGLVCEQTFKPEVDALRSAGRDVRDPDGRLWLLVLVLPPRQREHARAVFADALARLRPGGVVVAAMANDEGARSGEGDLARLAGPVASKSKFKCRVFWARPAAGQGDAALALEWRALDAPRPVVGGRFTSRPGLFAWDRVDIASALLAEHLPGDLAGRAADLGAGYGYLSAELLRRCPGITALHAYEGDARACALLPGNLAPYVDRVALDVRWHDVASGLPDRYDVVVTNAPFHAQSRAERPDIGRAFIAAAAAALEPGGRLWMVANRHLPYEEELAAGFGQSRVVAQRAGFKIVEAVRAARVPAGRPPRR